MFDIIQNTISNNVIIGYIRHNSGWVVENLLFDLYFQLIKIFVYVKIFQFQTNCCASIEFSAGVFIPLY